MKLMTYKRTLLLLLVATMTVASSLRAGAEDIDIFVGAAGGAGGANVLIVLDNTSNWSDNAHKWPGGLLQGQAELQALINLVPTLSANINVGLMMFNQNGNGPCCSGGYIRYAMQPMNATNQAALLAVLNDLYANITDPLNKAASNASYSMALFDAFKYFGGYTSPAHALDDVAGTPQDATNFGPAVFATPPSTFNKPDPLGYVPGSNYTVYSPPTAAADACGGKNYVIFVGNTVPNTDTPPSENMATFLTGVNNGVLPSQYKLGTFTTTTTTASTNLGSSSACYNNNSGGLGQCNTDNANTCGTSYDTCTCSTPTSTTGCSGSKVKYTIFGNVTTTNVTPTGSTCTPGTSGCGPIRYADEWTNFLYRTDVNAASGQQNVTTFTLDAFTANKQNADQTALLYNMACYAGGCGNYYAASNQNALKVAFGDIFSKIQSLDSAFASVSLPVSATNRALNANEVYLGMFRPDPDAKPLWYGNMKRYQIANFNGDFELADASSQAAVNPLTGFVKDCATSFWTKDSGKYWANVATNPSPAGLCPSPTNTPYDPFSDAPDGPKVEKGTVSEVLRRGNNPPTTDTSPTWALNRTVYTKGFTAFNTANTGMSANDVNFVNGLNIDPSGNSVTYTFTDASGASTSTSIRPTIHGDVVHSRPQPVNYGGSTGTVIYYGANDGTFRAVKAATGAELWAYVAPEFYSTLPRLRQNSPLIKYASVTDPNATPKNYYFDGSIGLYQNADNSKVWIYPTMRRGGRMIYAFDVTTPSSPSLKWKVGCPDLTDDTGCTPSAMSAIGQTWSTPNVATLKTGGTVGETATPVVVVGGGYDNCEDGAGNAACSGAKGSIIYVLDAASGSVLRSFTTIGRVTSDVALVDIDFDGIPDFAYVGDTRGNVYRISFGLSKTAPLAAASWTATRIAYTTGANRKFLYPPALLPAFDSASGHNIIYVALGSGDREQPLITQYPYTTPVLNRFYVYMDDVTATTPTNLDDATALCDFTSNTPCTTVTPQTDACGNKVVIPGSGKQGWFMDLDVCGPNAPDCAVGATVRGEQTVTSAAIVGGLLAFSTNRPVPPQANACARQGDARGYLVNVFSASGAICTADQSCVCGGDRSGDFVAGGLPPSPVVANIQIGDQVETIIIGAANKKGGASSGIQSEVGFTLKPQRRTRAYWRQEGNN